MIEFLIEPAHLLIPPAMAALSGGQARYLSSPMDALQVPMAFDVGNRCVCPGGS